MKRPKVTAGAIIEKRGKILLTKRNIKPYRDYWCLPGGHIERGEKAEEAVKREVKEETGLDFKPKFSRYYDEIIPRIGWHALVLIFVGKVSGKIKKQEKEVKEIKWFSKKELKKIKIAFLNRKAIEDYFKSKKRTVRDLHP